MKRLARALAIGALVMMGAPGCSSRKADRSEGEQTDIATLRKFVTLQPAPIAAKWSVTTIGDGAFGPSDTNLWAVVRYSDADFATVARALKADEPLPAMEGAPPDWLLADVDLARFRRGSSYVFGGPVSDGKPFASNMYHTGFALTLPDHCVLIYFSSE